MLDHQLQIDADHYLPVDAGLIPTGQIAEVSDTPFDFHTPRLIGNHGFDHNLCLSQTRQPLRQVAQLRGSSGVVLTVLTTEPGLQVYDGQKIPVRGLNGLDGRHYGPHGGLALETQIWPDAPNRPAFPDSILQAGQMSVQTTVYRFGR